MTGLKHYKPLSCAISYTITIYIMYITKKEKLPYVTHLLITLAVQQAVYVIHSFNLCSIIPEKVKLYLIYNMFLVFICILCYNMRAIDSVSNN